LSISLYNYLFLYGNSGTKLFGKGLIPANLAPDKKHIILEIKD